MSATETTEVQQQPANDSADALETTRAAQEMLNTVRGRLVQVDAAIATFTEMSTTANAKLNEIAEAATAAVAAKTAIADHQTVVAEKSAHIEDARKHADNVRADLDRSVTAATQKATEAEGLRTRAQSAADSVAPIVAAITTTKASTLADLTATNAARDEAKASAAATKALADKAAVVEERVAGYEGSLAKLQESAKARLATIDSLLPAATATGLAHAFDARRKTFLPTIVNGERWFIGSVLALVLLAATGLWEKHDTLEDLARLYMLRVPVAAALIWLAMHSVRNAALAKRLEEDYGFKAATAAQFQGFQNQMAEIETVAPDTPLAKLYADTLAIIADPPGRIYDKHQLTVKPSEEIAAVAAAAAAAVKDALSSAKKEEK